MLREARGLHVCRVDREGHQGQGGPREPSANSGNDWVLDWNATAVSRPQDRKQSLRQHTYSGTTGAGWLYTCADSDTRKGRTRKERLIYLTRPE